MDGDPAGMAERLEISGLSSGKEISEASKVGDPSLYDESEILGISGKVHNFNTIFGYDKKIHKTRKRIEIQIKDREKNDE